MTVLEAAVSRAAGRVEITYFPGYLIFSGVNVQQDDVRAGVRRDVAKLAGLEPTEKDMLLEAAPLLVEERIVGEHRQCRSFTIHSILADYDFVDLIKIDIEHREVQILGVARAGRVEANRSHLPGAGHVSGGHGGGPEHSLAKRVRRGLLPGCGLRRRALLHRRRATNLSAGRVDCEAG